MAAGDLSEIQEAVRDQFQRGGSFTRVVVVLLCILAGVLLAYVLTQLLGARPKRKRSDNPQLLFLDLLDELKISVPQRRLLNHMVRDLRLKQPSTILLSETLFDQFVTQWGDARRIADYDQQMIGELRAALFPAVS